MEILFISPYLDKFFFFPQFFYVLPFLIFSLLILYSSWKLKRSIRRYKLLFYTYLITSILMISFFFIPEIVIINIDSSEVVLSNIIIFSRFSVFYILTLIPQAVVLVYIGWINKDEFNNYWLISAGLFLLNVGWEYFSKLLERFNLVNLSLLSFNDLLFYINLIFLLLSLTSFTYLFIHGIYNDQKEFTSTGISMIFVDTYLSLMTGVILFLVLFS